MPSVSGPSNWLNWTPTSKSAPRYINQTPRQSISCVCFWLNMDWSPSPSKLFLHKTVVNSIQKWKIFSQTNQIIIEINCKVYSRFWDLELLWKQSYFSFQWDRYTRCFCEGYFLFFFYYTTRRKYESRSPQEIHFKLGNN